MRKLIFISLLAIPFCKAADYLDEAYNAAQRGNWQKVYELIDNDIVDVNKRRGNELPLITFAILKNDLEATRNFINRKAELNIALDWASRQYLMAMAEKKMPFIKLLLESGADPYAKGKSGQTIFEYFESQNVIGHVDENLRQTLIEVFKEHVSMDVKPAKKI